MAVFLDGYVVVRYLQGKPLAVTWVPYKEQKKPTNLCDSLGKDRATVIDKDTFNRVEYFDPQLVDQAKVTPETCMVNIDMNAWFKGNPPIINRS
jgi:hypothetical protein